MTSHNINIVGLNTLYKILNEINGDLPFKIDNFSEENNFLNLLNENKINIKNSIILANAQNKKLFLENKLINKNNVFFLTDKKDLNLNDGNYYIKFPIDIISFLEKINIQIIKHNYNNQSKIKINNYYLDLNSRTIHKEERTLKLTEREVDIILFLNDQDQPKKINNLQEKVWGYSSDLETHTVETHIYRLRKKISENFKDNNFIISTDDGYIIK